ncbi:hypothetical protein Bca4012_090025 [Brassica carinata]
MLSHLPADLVEEILSRVPATSLKRLRSTCKKWNALFKDNRFIEKHLCNVPKQLRVLILEGCGLYPTSVDLNSVPPSIEFSDELSLNNSYNSEKGKLGGSNKTMVACVSDGGNHGDLVDGFEIYDFNSNAWRVVNAPNCFVIRSHGVALKGNAYWNAYDDKDSDYLLRSSTMEMWVTNTNCEADLSWSKSFEVDYGFDVYTSLLIDERKKVALCCNSYFGEDRNVQGIESDVFGKSPRRRWDERSGGGDSETWEDYHAQLLQEIDDMNSAFEEWDGWEIDCSDFSSLCRNRGRGWKTR